MPLISPFMRRDPFCRLSERSYIFQPLCPAASHSNSLFLFLVPEARETSPLSYSHLFVFSLALPSLFSWCGWVPGTTLAQTQPILALRMGTSWFRYLPYFLLSFKRCFYRAWHTPCFCSPPSLVKEPLLYTSPFVVGADGWPWLWVDHSIFPTKRSSVLWHSCLVSFLEC